MTESDPGAPVPAAAAPQAASGPPPLAGRLHPLTILFAGLQGLRGWIVPIVIVVVVGRSPGFLAFAAAAAVIPALIFAAVRYYTFTYSVDDAELVIRHGLLSRTERHVPLERVQDLRFEQGLLQRAAGVVVVHVDTAGGQGPEASLAVLSQDAAQALRQRVFARGARQPSAAGQPAGPEEIPLRRIGTAELLLAGATSTRLASGLVVFGGAFALLNDVVGDAPERSAAAMSTASRQLGALPPAALAVLAAGAFAALVLLGVVVSAVGHLLLFHGFTLSLRGEDLHRAHGLFTRRASSLPRRRIQVLEIEEGLLRRAFGLALVRADTAGGGGQEGARRSGRDVLLPVARADELPALLPRLVPDLDGPAPPWTRVSRLAIRRGVLRGTLLLALAASLLWAWKGPWGAWPLLLLPLVAWAAVLRWRHGGYSWDGTWFRTRRGVLRRSTHLVPVRNVQAVVLSRTPFDRRLGLATLSVDTAGQAYTGGGPRVANLPLDEARRLAAELSRCAAATRYRW